MSADARTSVTGHRSTSGWPFDMRADAIPESVSNRIPDALAAPNWHARLVTHSAALPHISATDPSLLQYSILNCAPLTLVGTRNTMPSAPTPVPRAQT